MDISHITAPAVLGTGLVTPIATSRTVATEQAQNLSFLGVAPTTVDLSSSGRFLSLASLFQKKTLDLHTSVLTNADTSKALADATVAAAAVAGAFDQLQTSAVDSNGLPTDTLDGQSLQSQFFQQLGGTADDAEASLAAIGLAFTEATSAAPSRLTVDEAMLEDAFDRDPGATSALLERAAGAFVRVIGTQIQAQAANLSFLDDDSVFGAALPLPGAIPQELAPAPSYPNAQPASFTDNMFLQNLVTENLRNETTLVDERASAVAPPVALADLVEDNIFPMQANLIAPPQIEAPPQGTRVAALPQAPEAPSDAVIAANVAPADVRQLATSSATQAPITTAPTAMATPAVAAASATQDRFQSAPTATTPAASTVADPDTTANNAVSVAQQARVLGQQLQAEREATRELDEKIAGASDAVRTALTEDIVRRDASRASLLNTESSAAQRRADQLEPALTGPAAPDRSARFPDAMRTAATAQPAIGAQDTDRERTPQPSAIAAQEQAHLAARDPAIAAAIAAYNVNTGAFAAQNSRPDIQPPKAKPVAPVAAVTKVEPTAALGTPGDHSAPLR